MTAFSVIVARSKSFSLGEITLRSSNIYDHPLIDPKHFSDEGDADLNILGEGR